MKKKPTQDDPEQSKRFVETAKELDTDKSGAAFDKAINGLLSSNSPPVALKPKTPVVRNR